MKGKLSNWDCFSLEQLYGLLVTNYVVTYSFQRSWRVNHQCSIFKIWFDFWKYWWKVNNNTNKFIVGNDIYMFTFQKQKNIKQNSYKTLINLVLV